MPEEQPPGLRYEFPRRVLLATVGLVPQVITETVYALAKEPAQPFVPTEIHVVTTSTGSKAVREALLGNAGKMAALADDLSISSLAHALAPDRIHVIRSMTGGALDDINSALDQDAAADLITSLVRGFASDPLAALHGSIAGGRKSMGFLLGYAFTLFGRAQDRLSHVLVNAPFETHKDFYFPPKFPCDLALRDGSTISTADAVIMLADVPFVRLRENLPREILDGSLSHSESVRRAQQAMPEPRLVIDHATRSLACSDIPIRLQPKPFALYAWLARRRRDGKQGVHWWNGDPAELLAEYRKTGGVSDGAKERQEQNLMAGIPTADFETNKSRVNSVLTAHLGRLAKPFLIQTLGPVPGNAHYSLSGLELPPQAISFGPVAWPEEETATAEDG